MFVYNKEYFNLKSKDMKKISKLEMKQLFQSLELIDDAELATFIGGGIHYYVNSRGYIEERSGDEYIGYYIYCGENSLEISGSLNYALYDTGANSVSYIENGSYSIFMFLADNTSVEYGFFSYIDDENPLSDETQGFVVTSHDNREGNIGYPEGANYNTQIHSHPKVDGESGNGPSLEDKENKIRAEENGSQIKYYGVYNPSTGKIVFY